ncbi:unnamed protein product [Mytilus coruscus]|uniref:Ig-like domain-containing protein n=1 Tax=Mytilus coruscus TaxID=42192 RepID=A0A6J8BEV3_MYTCO|nr:unnamed protein product [Mytilus coruscus]
MNHECPSMKEVHFDCLSNNRLPKQTVAWLNNTVGRQESHNLSTACLYFDNIRRIDGGIYICRGEQEGKRVTKNVTLNVLFTYSSEDKPLSSKDVVIIVLLVLIAVLLAVTGIYVQNSNHIISTNDTIDVDNMNIIQMSEEQHSSLSINNSDTPEHLDNGYEYPYTTLVTNSEDEDSHVYITTKQNSINENTYPSINAACEQSVEIV